MADVLSQYALPYDPLRPLICFDERPCQLLGDVLVPLPMKPGRPRRYDDAYERHGTCGVLLAFAPHRGFRSLEVRPRRTALDYAQFMQTLGQRYAPTAACIRLVQDTLNTHTPGAFYQVLPPEQAFDCARSLHGTIRRKKVIGSIWPKSSWRRCRNNVEIAALQIKRRWPKNPACGNIGAIMPIQQSNGALRKWRHAANSRVNILH